ncbi:MAG TPA: glycoside hydrolase family 9 protein [Bacteroidota bacterium]|nr:glycoside hydrolase family 9 protein [Bacteroidota bacterium]
MARTSFARFINHVSICIVVAMLSPALLCASVMVNQAGYLPAGDKTFFTTTQADSFRVHDASTGEVQFAGKLTVSRLNDPATGLNVYKGDFSALTRPGTYYVLIPNTHPLDESVNFTIAPDVYLPLYNMSLKGFYLQRCGQSIPPLFGGVYARSGCHSNDGTFHSTAEGTGYMAAVGGWHDAGDYGKYIVNAGVTVGTLLMAYELFPTRFAADDLKILGSGNSVPDILDETRFELEWMLKMQQASSGGVFSKLTREKFEGFVMPSADNSVTRYIYQIATTATGDFAAVMARASRVYRAFDPAFADTCLAASRRAWAYLQAHPTIVPTGGFKNPIGTETGEYGDANDSDERLWAASELFSATGESAFGSYYALNYSKSSLISQTMGWGNVRTMAHLAYYYAQQPTANAAIKAALKQSLLDYANAIVTQANAEGFKVAIKPGEYVWGSNSEVLNRGLLLILASRESGGTPAMLSAAQSQLNYILGANAHNLSFVTGVGARHVMNPHHRPSASDGVTEPVPGLVAGGPDQNRSDATLKSRFTTSTPPALIYADVMDSYASNEIAINWNAPLVFVAGYFAAEGQSVSGVGSRDGSRSDVMPDGYRLEQNHPNPFNPSTVITVTIPERSRVVVDIFDTTGRRVAGLLNGELSAGTHDVAFDATGLPSGVYLYRMTARTGATVYTQTKRALLVK